MSAALEAGNVLPHAPFCSVCAHPKRGEIDVALLAESDVEVAERYGLGKVAMWRHRAHGHVANDIVRGFDLRRIQRVKKLGERIELLLAESLDILTDARTREIFVRCPNEHCEQRFPVEVTDIRSRVAAAAQVGKTLELIGRVTGEISSAQVQMLFVSLGVKDESELRSALDTHRSSANVSLDDLLEECLTGLRFVLAERPELKARVLSALESGAEIVTENEHGNGTNGAS